MFPSKKQNFAQLGQEEVGQGDEGRVKSPESSETVEAVHTASASAQASASASAAITDSGHLTEINEWKQLIEFQRVTFTLGLQAMPSRMALYEPDEKAILKVAVAASSSSESEDTLLLVDYVDFKQHATAEPQVQRAVITAGEFFKSSHMSPTLLDAFDKATANVALSEGEKAYRKVLGEVYAKSVDNPHNPWVRMKKTFKRGTKSRMELK